jgi:hypothetical protein
MDSGVPPAAEFGVVKTRLLFTLRQLSFTGRTIYCVCRDCGHYSVAQLDLLVKRMHGWDVEVSHVQQYMRCRKCRRRGNCFFQPTRPEPPPKVCRECGQVVRESKRGVLQD